MLSAVRQFFSPAVFPDDEAKTRLTRVTFILTMATLVIASFGLVAGTPFFASKIFSATIILTVIGLLLTVNALLRRGQQRPASFLYVAMLWLLATALLYIGAGTSSPALSLYVALAVTAGIMLGVRWAVGVAVLNTIVVLGVALLEINDYPFPHIFLEERPLVRWFDFSLYLFLAITPVYLILNSLSEALNRVRQENERRREAEQAIRASGEYFRALIENAHDIITVLDADGTIRFESPAVERVLGYKPEELVGQNVFGFIHPDDKKAVLDVFQQLLQYASQPRSIEFRFKHSDGSWRYLEAVGRNLLHNPVVQGSVINSRDITERKQLEEQIRQNQKMESLGRLAGGIAHDFNNILVPIVGYVELSMMNLSPEEKLYARLKSIREAADRATDLTRQILAFSRKQVLEMQVCDLNELITDFEKMIHRLIREDIDLHIFLDPALYRVKADKGQITQVLLNLVVNARDAMPHGGKLTIETANVHLDEDYIRKHTNPHPPGNFAMIAVSDTGYGMDAKTQQQIFDPFFTTKVQGQGTGLGLSTVFGIIKQHGSNIWVYSEPEKGTTFKIYLPQTEDASITPDTTGVKPTSLYGAETVLVVEDEERVRQFVCETLAEYGYEVIAAKNGVDALKQISAYNKPIHLLLTDVIMPEMNGRNLYQNVAVLYPDIKVLYMSGYTDNVIVHHGILEEGTNFLQKPFTILNLTEKVRKALG